jgi:hypothetical protein
LRINNTYTVDGSCNVSGLPALKIIRTDAYGSCGSIGGGTIPFPTGQAIVDIQKYINNLGTWQLDPVLIVSGKGYTGLGMVPQGTNRLSVNGNSYFSNNVQVKNKFRINNGVLANADWNSINFPYTFSVDSGDSRFLGRVQIGTATQLRPVTTFTNYALAVAGRIVCQQAIVQTADWADYVFDDAYKLMPLPELAKFVKHYHHLPAMPNAEVVVQQGQDIATLQRLQQEKIEELTLYVIKLQEDIELLKTKIKDNE